MKTYWLIFSDGQTLRGNIEFADAYCKMNSCTFKVLCATTIRGCW